MNPLLYITGNGDIQRRHWGFPECDYIVVTRKEAAFGFFAARIDSDCCARCASRSVAVAMCVLRDGYMQVYVGISICNPMDKFNLRYGLEKAAGRARAWYARNLNYYAINLEDDNGRWISTPELQDRINQIINLEKNRVRVIYSDGRNPYQKEKAA